METLEKSWVETMFPAQPKPKPRKVLSMRAGYMDPAHNLTKVGREFKEMTHGVDYDTIVGTGLSGALVVPYLARLTHKHALIVRKPSDGSHTSLPAEGDLGRRWIFVDDFINTGRTGRRVIHTIQHYAESRKWETEFVGTYEYSRQDFTPFDDGDDFTVNHYLREKAGETF